eukprot:scaffold7897_cov403-Prasinococcus_capsulatus_cf.AAC.2
MEHLARDLSTHVSSVAIQNNRIIGAMHSGVGSSRRALKASSHWQPSTHAGLANTSTRCRQPTSMKYRSS